VGLALDSAIAPARDITITRVDGTKVKLSDYRGKPLIIGFGLTTCSRSASDFPKLNALWNAYKDAGLQVVCTVGADAATSSSYMSSEDLTMPFCTNYWDLIFCYSNQTSIYTPLYFIIDSKGNCIQILEKKIDWRGVKDYLDNR
jgi:glutathione peroxidase-family protein